MNDAIIQDITIYNTHLVYLQWFLSETLGEEASRQYLAPPKLCYQLSLLPLLSFHDHSEAVCKELIRRRAGSGLQSVPQPGRRFNRLEEEDYPLIEEVVRVDIRAQWDLLREWLRERGGLLQDMLDKYHALLETDDQNLFLWCKDVQTILSFGDVLNKPFVEIVPEVGEGKEELPLVAKEVCEIDPHWAWRVEKCGEPYPEANSV
ncbi:hypothetical protein T439DRAFT_335269 [Meredithblackwellia eburnea MCA 4105]